MENVRFFSFHLLNLTKKPKKYKKLSNDALQGLKEAFNKSHYPSKEFLDEFAQKINETQVRVKNWFRTERKKWFSKGTLSYEVFIIIRLKFNIVLEKTIF